MAITMAPEISVIIPVCNQQDTIEGCLESVLRQNTQKNFEVIVIDNNSTDKTRGILQNYKDRVSVLYEKERNVAKARNKGLKNAKGSLIFFIDATCYAEENWLQQMVKTLVRGKKIVGGQVRAAKVDSLIRKYCDVFCHNQGSYYQKGFFATCNMGLNLGQFSTKPSFKLGLKRSEDVEFCYRYIQKRNEIEYNKRAIVYYGYSSSLVVLLNKSFVNGKWVGVVNTTIKKNFLVTKLTYREIFNTYGINFLYLKILQDIFFRLGLLVGVTCTRISKVNIQFNTF